MGEVMGLDNHNMLKHRRIASFQTKFMHYFWITSDITWTLLRALLKAYFQLACRHLSSHRISHSQILSSVSSFVCGHPKYSRPRAQEPTRIAAFTN